MQQMILIEFNTEINTYKITLINNVKYVKLLDIEVTVGVLLQKLMKSKGSFHVKNVVFTLRQRSLA